MALSLRRLLETLFPVEADLVAFCLDYFPKVHYRFGGGMDRVAKENLLLEIVEHTELLAALRRHDPAAVARLDTPSPSSNPYRGLSPFRREDAPFFFGREQLIEKLWHGYAAMQQADSPRVLAVLGPSGAGKSSLVLAGLLPALSQRPLPGPTPPAVVALRPGQRPLEALARGLLQITHPRPASPAVLPDVEAVRALRAALRAPATDPDSQGAYDGLRLFAASLPVSDGTGRPLPLLLVVDQSEELYSLCEDVGERDAFVAGLLHAAADRGRQVSVVMTLRSDFLGQTQRHHPDWNRVIADHAVVVPAMSAEELRLCIAAPAIGAGQPLDDATVELLLSQAREHTGALPLLEYTLEVLWNSLLAQAKQAVGRQLTAAQILHQLGGVGGALAGRAEAVYRGLNSEATSEKAPPSRAQQQVRRTFVRLLQHEDGLPAVRRRQSLADLVAEGEDELAFRAALERFATEDVRLLTFSSGEDGVYVELTHEALLQYWQRFRAWVDDARHVQPLIQRLSASARRWQQKGCPSWLLWQRDDLAELRQQQERLTDELGQAELGFFRASERAERRTRWLTRTAVAVALLVAAAVSTLGLYARNQQHLAEQQKQLADQRLADATAVVENLLFKIDRRLQTVAGAADVRLDLLQQVSGLLDRLRAHASETADALHARSTAHNERGDLALSQGNLANAALEYEAALLLAQQLATRWPDNPRNQRDLWVSNNKLGKLARARGKLESAQTAFTIGLQIMKKLAEAEPNMAKWQRDLSVSYEMLGDLARSQRKLSDAQSAFENVLQIRKKLADASPNNVQWQRDLSISYEKLGEVAQEQEKLAEARAAIAMSVQIMETLAGAEPNNAELQRDLGVSYSKFADISKAQGNLMDAYVAFNKGLQIIKKLVAAEPNNAEWQRDLIYSFGNLAEVALLKSDRIAARRWIEQAESSLRSLERVLAGDVQMSKVREWIADLKRQSLQ